MDANDNSLPWPYTLPGVENKKYKQVKADVILKK